MESSTKIQNNAKESFLIYMLEKTVPVKFAAISLGIFIVLDQETMPVTAPFLKEQGKAYSVKCTSIHKFSVFSL